MTIADSAIAVRPKRARHTDSLGALLRWIAARRAARAQKAALQSLLFAPEYRLRDLGITRDELVRAISERTGGKTRPRPIET